MEEWVNTSQEQTAESKHRTLCMQDEWHGFFRNLQEDKGEGGGTSRKAYETPNSVYDSFRSCFKQTIKVFFPDSVGL